MIKIPDKITVGPYDVLVVDTKDLLLERNNCGEWFPNKQEIHLDSTLKGIDRWETFIHEALEAVTATLNVDVSHHSLSLLATGMAQALKPVIMEE